MRERAWRRFLRRRGAGVSSARAYGNFARLLGHYVRDTHGLTLQEAVRRLKTGQFADVVVFDPAAIGDHANFEQPAQLATGVGQVLVNGRFALRDGKPTGAGRGGSCAGEHGTRARRVAAAPRRPPGAGEAARSPG